jgi:uncharacterized membrane-anchored protein YhcB (DUF1043 family)
MIGIILVILVSIECVLLIHLVNAKLIEFQNKINVDIKKSQDILDNVYKELEKIHAKIAHIEDKLP